MERVSDDDLIAHPVLRRLARALAERPGTLAPDDGEPRRAAVAIVLRATAASTLELLLIKRSVREGDPWSGQMALPGGRQEPGDSTLQDTAIRETREETGIDISGDGMVLGTLDELRPRVSVLPSIIVTPFVAVVRPELEMTTSEEVAEAFWVPLASLLDPEMRVESTVDASGSMLRVPSYRLGENIVWGMTQRMLDQLLRLLD